VAQALLIAHPHDEESCELHADQRWEAGGRAPRPRAGLSGPPPRTVASMKFEDQIVRRALTRGDRTAAGIQRDGPPQIPRGERPVPVEDEARLPSTRHIQPRSGASRGGGLLHGTRAAWGPDDAGLRGSPYLRKHRASIGDARGDRPARNCGSNAKRLVSTTRAPLEPEPTRLRQGNTAQSGSSMIGIRGSGAGK